MSSPPLPLCKYLETRSDSSEHAIFLFVSEDEVCAYYRDAEYLHDVLGHEIENGVVRFPKWKLHDVLWELFRCDKTVAIC